MSHPYVRRLNWSPLLAALAVCCAMLMGQASAQEPSRVFIPSFWDPLQKPDKPDLSSIRVIRFLTEDDYPPMHFLTEDGKLAGFNVDLARAVCDALNVACTVQARRWDTLFDSLREGRGDAVAASVRASPKLRETSSSCSTMDVDGGW